MVPLLPINDLVPAYYSCVNVSCY